MYGDRIKLERNKLNLSQEKLAEKLNVQKSTVSNWELNKAQPSYEKLKELATFFGISTDELLGHQIENIDATEKLKKVLLENNIENVEQAIQLIEVLKNTKHS
ncbi:MAG: helix-turn-helix transcriptional regulator [Bacilli bacterium]|nr:helix-turn-helix transcriptional regulator [Bacilli bacterium]